MPQIEQLKQRSIRLLNRLKWLLAIAFVTNCIYVTAFMLVEHRNFDDAMWWGWVTGFTVGYGDISPITHTGRLIAVCAMMTDFILLAFFAAQITALVLIDKNIFSHHEQELQKYRARVAEQIAREQLASNYRIEAHLGCLPKNLPELPSYKTDEEIIEEIRQKELQQAA